MWNCLGLDGARSLELGVRKSGGYVCVYVRASACVYVLDYSSLCMHALCVCVCCVCARVDIKMCQFSMLIYLELPGNMVWDA